MNNNTYVVISYINYKLKVMIFLSYDNKSFLLYEELICKKNIVNLTNDLEKDKIEIKIKSVLEHCKEKYKLRTLDLNVIFESREFFESNKKVKIEFGENHVINEEDINKLKTNAQYGNNTKDGFVPIGYDLTDYIIDEAKNVSVPVGIAASSITSIGNVIYSDNDTFYAIKSLVDKYNVLNYYVAQQIIKNYSDLENGMGIMEIELNQINFTVNQDNALKHFSINFGIQSFVNNLYDELVLLYDKSEAARAVSFFIEYKPLYKYDLDVNITENIKINEVIDIFTKNIDIKFNMIFHEIDKRNIQCNNYKVIVYDFINQIIDFLNETQEVELKKYILKSNKNAASENIKAHLLVNKIIKK